MDELEPRASVRALLLRELKRACADPARADVLTYSEPSGNGDADLANWIKQAVAPCLYGPVPENAASPEAFAEALVDNLMPANNGDRKIIALLRAEFEAALSFLKGKTAASTDDLHLYAPRGPFEKPGTAEDSATDEACRLLVETLAAGLASGSPPSRRPPLIILFGREDKLTAAALGRLGNLLMLAKRKKSFDTRLLISSGRPDTRELSRRLGSGNTLRIRGVRNPPAKNTDSSKSGAADVPPGPLPSILRHAGPVTRRWLACSCFLPAPTRDYFELLLGVTEGRKAFRAVERWTSAGLHGRTYSELTLPPLPADFLRAELRATDPPLYDQVSSRESRIRGIQDLVPIPEHRQALIRLSLFLRFTASLVREVYPRQAPMLIRFIESHPEYFSPLYGSYRLSPPFNELFAPALSWLSPEKFNEKQKLVAKAWETEQACLQDELDRLRYQAKETLEKRKALDEAIRSAEFHLPAAVRNPLSKPRASAIRPPAVPSLTSDPAWRFLMRSAPVLGIVLLYVGIYLGDALLFLVVLLGTLTFIGGSTLPAPGAHSDTRTERRHRQPAGFPVTPTIPRNLRLAKIRYQNLISQNRTIRSTEQNIASLIAESEALLSEPFIAARDPSPKESRRAHALMR